MPLFRRKSFGDPSSFLSVLILLAATLLGKAAVTGSYAYLEASFTITNSISNPFDYTQADVQVQILQPDASTVSLPAFYDGGTTWRVRHTPMMPGVYQVTGVTLNGQPLTVDNLQPTSWTVSGAPVGDGFVSVDPTKPRRFITSDGERYFPVGHNVAWWTNNTRLSTAFYKMGAAHENWSRVWMMQFYDSLNLEWPRVGNLGEYSLSVAQKWDTIVSAAEQAGIHFQMTLQHHGQYSSANGSNVNPNWEQNPYNFVNGGFLTNATDFFTDPTAIALTKQKYRYIIARWGYSPAILAWELFNEVQFTDAAYANQWTNIEAWHNEMASFIRSQDHYHHLITSSSDLTKPIWDQTDYYQHHNYPSDLITGMRDAEDISASQTVAPDFSGECGINFTPHVGVSPPIWAGLMAAQSGDAMPWYWDTIDPNNDYGLFRAVSDFVKLSGLADQDTLTKLIPQVTGGTLSALTFAPGGGYATNTGPDIFTVGDAAPDGIGGAPSFLQGNYHRAMTPNGYTFLVNYTQSGTFSVQILTIASAGAGFQMIVDGATNVNRSFPSTGSDVSTNLTVTASISSGAHTIRIYNPGLDWINLGNITLTPYVPGLAAYAIGNSNFNATWIWNRTNVFSANASSTISGAVEVAGLNAGNYSATWWDTFAGTAISNSTITVTSSNVPVILNTPPILRSAALYVGLPAHASIGASSLIQTAATNSPPVSVPITITNSGGLPLAYSLSVTGASPVIYSAVNSAQSEGPFFAWKDISAVGQDISSNFTALAAPKTAKDEGIAGPINIGFAFPFFNGSQTPGTFTQLYISPNGYVAFSPFSGDTSVNAALPGNSAPSNSIALFWDDLDLSTSGHVYAFTDPITETFTVQFQNVRFKNTTSTVTCQLVLKTTGEILMQYQSMAFSNTCTIGVQNAARNQGLTVAFNQNYLQNTNFAIRLTPTPWLNFSSSAGFVPKAGSQEVDATFNPAGLAVGVYNATLLINTGDALLPVTILPVSLTISGSDNTPPTLNPVSNQTINVGQTAAFTANASDTDSPPQILTFSLLNGPTNAALMQINNTNATFDWRPLVTQADTTNQFILEVVDNGSPSLNATQNFKVTVNPLAPLAVSSVGWSNGQLRLQISGDEGPDYGIETSTNLMAWSTLLITNSPVMPWAWVDTNSAALPMQFYRVKVGPPLP